MLLLLGIVTGKIVFEFILEHRLVKYIKPSKKTIYITSILGMVILSFVTLGMHSGNIISYLTSKSNLKEYITSTYGIDEFELLSTKFNRSVDGKYVYEVRIDGQDVCFVPVTKNIFKDANMSKRLNNLNDKLHLETDKMLTNINSKYTLLEIVQAKYSLGYTKFGVTPDTTIFSVKCKQELDDLKEFYEELSNYITEIMEYKKANKIVITINDKSLEILEKDIQNITAEYIKGGFEIEEISK